MHSRHTRDLTRPELLKAIRALSWRYVESRNRPDRPDAFGSSGKRAAFAVFYAPLHFLTVQEIVRALDARLDPDRRLLDLGCGTGVASAAWALEMKHGSPPSIRGVDAHPWAVTEAAWTWRTLGLTGRARQGDLADALERAVDTRAKDPPVALFGWSVNELPAPARARVRMRLDAHLARDGTALVIEPIARRLSPWWDDWTTLFERQGGRADEWSFDAELPGWLAELNEAAGFSERRLAARSLWRAARG